MTASTSSAPRARTRDEIKPLVELCKAGRLFDVQEWIRRGAPVNMPPAVSKCTQPRTPLEYAIDSGFHSLVETLLAAGAIQEGSSSRSPLSRAVQMRRLDLAQLLLEHGAHPSDVPFADVLRSWDPDMMRLFVTKGADLRTGMPFAHAFCERVRTSIAVYRECRSRDDDLQRQADAALRHHCYHGDTKWVSLMLWAGADPSTRGALGPPHPARDSQDEEFGLSAFEYAATGEHYSLLEMPKILDRLRGPLLPEFLCSLIEGEGIALLERLLDTGVDPNAGEEGCPAIRACLARLGWSWCDHRHATIARDAGTRDTPGTRDLIKCIHILARHGGRWQPREPRDTESARRALRSVSPDYTAEFIWIMRKYDACDPAAARELVRTESIRRHCRPVLPHILEVLDGWHEEQAEKVSRASDIKPAD